MWRLGGSRCLAVSDKSVLVGTDVPGMLTMLQKTESMTDQSPEKALIVLTRSRSWKGLVETNPDVITEEGAQQREAKLGLSQLCQHNFEHNRMAKVSSIMPA